MTKDPLTAPQIAALVREIAPSDRRTLAPGQESRFEYASSAGIIAVFYTNEDGGTARFRPGPLPTEVPPAPAPAPAAAPAAPAKVPSPPPVAEAPRQTGPADPAVAALQRGAGGPGPAPRQDARALPRAGQERVERPAPPHRPAAGAPVARRDGAHRRRQAPGGGARAPHPEHHEPEGDGASSRSGTTPTGPTRSTASPGSAATPGASASGRSRSSGSSRPRSSPPTSWGSPRRSRTSRISRRGWSWSPDRRARASRRPSPGSSTWSTGPARTTSSRSRTRSSSCTRASSAS